jgi:hypothetical protein
MLISYTNEHLHTDHFDNGCRSVKQIAEAKTTEAVLQAYGLGLPLPRPRSNLELFNTDICRWYAVILDDLILVTIQVLPSLYVTLERELYMFVLFDYMVGGDNFLYSELRYVRPSDLYHDAEGSYDVQLGRNDSRLQHYIFIIK